MKRQSAKFHPFLHAAANLEKHLEVLFADSNIRHRQALVLDALRAIGTSSQQYLAKHFGVSAGTMSSMISRLEALGYVQRGSDPSDRRIEMISNTPVGLAALEEVEKYWSDGDEIVERILGSKDTETFFALADKLSKGLGGGPPKPGKAANKRD
ncbi:MAG: MarR family winged helix-turn-helix transcriptional regulator [Paracoccaceae bacterium]